MALLAGELAPPGARLVEVRSGVSVVEVDGPWSEATLREGPDSQGVGSQVPGPGSQLPGTREPAPDRGAGSPVPLPGPEITSWIGMYSPSRIYSQQRLDDIPKFTRDL